ncbi:aminotransferase [Rathayibacter soli]|uniref:aminotransferase n=1 Tax=Rathayibacter soli TaxID=3144168 RepID=UPI0027E5467E|nr:aminotransferase [Glaciibacter superstes]
MFDFFAGRELIRPDATLADAEGLAAELFGVVGTAHELGSQQDRNFRIDSIGNDVDGTTYASYLLKIDNAAFGAEEIAAQAAAMEHLQGVGLRIPRPVHGRNGAVQQFWRPQSGAADDAYSVRMFTFVPGRSLVGTQYLSPSVVGSLGRISATVARGLADHPDGDASASAGTAVLERRLQWDLRNAERVIDRLLGSVADASKRDTIAAATAAALGRLATVAETLRVQPIHGDITDDNVVCTRAENGRLEPDGVIDFGDLALGWLVAELAVTVSSILPHRPHEPLAALAAISEFDRIIPLTDAEITALWPLVVLRGAVLVVSGEHQTALEAGNEYAEQRMAAEWVVFESASSIGWQQAEAAIRMALRRDPSIPGALPASALVAATPMLVGLADAAVLDFSVTSHALDDGRWSEPDVEWQLARQALETHAVAIAPYGQYRLTRSGALRATEPATYALVTELFTVAGAQVRAPADAQVVQVGVDELVLGMRGGELTLSGTIPSAGLGDTVRAGDVVGTVAPRGAGAADAIGRIRVQRRPAAQGTNAQPTDARHLDAQPTNAQRTSAPVFPAPAFAAGASAAAWSALLPDPAELLGLQPMPCPFDAADAAAREAERRERILAGAQEKYYEHPPQFERGWREFLIGIDGRVYLDMVNNVSAIGHSHPRLTHAVADQLALLNTNSRFLYRSLADLSERIVALAPDPSLDTVLLVNSGSEAVDLALHLARVHTGRDRILALREAYHGWTMASDAVTTSAYDNPNALKNRPDWVRLVDAPNTYRGRYRGADAGEEYLADFVRELDAAGAGPADATPAIAAFICEPVLGNAGGVLLPDGYLAGAYRAVRERGGLCIADEVQVGYGRLGEFFWGVQQQGVVPDIITVAKAMGNGYPLGAVLTRREIAESLEREGHFFSSAGGSPVSCAAGLAVLDVMRDECLQENARIVGAHLRERLETLVAAPTVARHPHDPPVFVGSVHGLGLYLGVELVRDPVTREPAAAETAAICERLLELGVIMQATSERQNVLKIKPPLCLSLADADFFVDALQTVLAEGW